MKKIQLVESSYNNMLNRQLTQNLKLVGEIKFNIILLT